MKVIDRLAADLGREFPGVEGFGARNLRNMRDIAKEWPDASIVQQLVSKLPWGHNIQILRLPAGPEREWYAHAAIEYGWSHAVLVHQIEPKFFERQGKAGDTSRKGILRTLRLGEAGSGDSEGSEATLIHPFICVPSVIACQIDALPAERGDLLKQSGIEGM